MALIRTIKHSTLQSLATKVAWDDAPDVLQLKQFIKKIQDTVFDFTLEDLKDFFQIPKSSAYQSSYDEHLRFIATTSGEDLSRCLELGIMVLVAQYVRKDPALTRRKGSQFELDMQDINRDLFDRSRRLEADAKPPVVIKRCIQMNAEIMVTGKHRRNLVILSFALLSINGHLTARPNDFKRFCDRLSPTFSLVEYGLLLNYCSRRLVDTFPSAPKNDYIQYRYYVVALQSASALLCYLMKHQPDQIVRQMHHHFFTQFMDMMHSLNIRQDLKLHLFKMTNLCFAYTLLSDSQLKSSGSGLFQHYPQHVSDMLEVLKKLKWGFIYSHLSASKCIEPMLSACEENYAEQLKKMENSNSLFRREFTLGIYNQLISFDRSIGLMTDEVKNGLRV